VIKRIFAIAVLIVVLTSTAALCAEPPTLLFKLNADGTTEVTFTASIEGIYDDIDEAVESSRMMAEQDGYTVEAGEDGNSVVFNKTLPKEDGYILDTTTIGAPKHKFVVMNGLLRTGYVFVNQDFDATQAPPSDDIYCTITVVTPVRASYASATHKNSAAKTYTWDIKSGYSNEIVLLFYKYNYGAMAAVVIIAAAIALLCVLLLRRKKPPVEVHTTPFTYKAPIIEEAIVDPESENAVVDEFFGDIDEDVDDLAEEEEFLFDEPTEVSDEASDEE